MTATLLPALPIVEGETIPGYVSRYAKLFGITARDFCSDVGMRWPWLCSAHESQLERLAWLTGQPLWLLEFWNPQKIGRGRYTVGHAVAGSSVFRRTAVRLCPQCVATPLAVNKYHLICQKLEWSVLSIHGCSRHGCQLITLPSALHSHATYDFASRVVENRMQVLQAAEEPEVLPATVFETYTRNRIQHGPMDDWLQPLDLTDLYHSSLALGAALEGLKASDLRVLPSVEERLVCETGFKRLVQGADAYKDALADLYGCGNADRPYYSSDLGPLYKWLSKASSDPALAKLTEATRAHILARYPISPQKDVFGKKHKIRNGLQWKKHESGRASALYSSSGC